MKRDFRKDLSSKALSYLLLEKDSKSRFIKEACLRVFHKPNLLNEKWVNSINKWASEIKDYGEITPADKYPVKGVKTSTLDSLVIKRWNIKKQNHLNKYIKSINDKPEQRFSGLKDTHKIYRNYIAEDSSGWKYLFRYYYFLNEIPLQIGQIISLTDVYISEHREGISFIKNFNIKKDSGGANHENS